MPDLVVAARQGHLQVHGLRARIAANAENGFARLGRIAAPMDLAALSDDVFLERLEIEIEIRDDVILDRDAFIAQGTR